MKRVLWSVVALCVAVGVFYGLAWFGGAYLRENPDALPPALQFLAPGSAWSETILKILGFALLGPTIAAFIVSLARLGENKKIEHQTYLGSSRMKLTIGIKAFTVLAAAGMTFVAVMAYRESPNVLMGVVFSVFAGAFIFGAVWTLRAYVEWDETRLRALGYSMRRKEFAWRDLTSIQYNKESMEYHLKFGLGKGKTLKVSQFFAGVDRFIATAAIHARRNNEHLSG